MLLFSFATEENLTLPSGISEGTSHTLHCGTVDEEIDGRLYAFTEGIAESDFPE